MRGPLMVAGQLSATDVLGILLGLIVGGILIVVLLDILDGDWQ